jgi:hypothetical protein
VEFLKFGTQKTKCPGSGGNGKTLAKTAVITGYPDNNHRMEKHEAYLRRSRSSPKAESGKVETGTGVSFNSMTEVCPG